MSAATGIGSMPGEDFLTAVRLVVEELPDLPHLPELPVRGTIADLTGRAVAVTGELGFDLQPAGWRLTDAPGVDHRRARSLLAQDLDVLEEQLDGYEGRFKVQVCGPWTLASTVEKPRGDKVLSDFGARRELAQALAEGVREHLADVQRRIPRAELVLQLDEPALPFVLGGQVPTASGFNRHRSVTPPLAQDSLEWVLAAAEDRATVVHCCASEVPIALLRRSGAGGISLDLASARGRRLRGAGGRPRRGRPGVARGRARDRSLRSLDQGAAGACAPAAGHARFRPGGGLRPAGAHSVVRPGRRRRGVRPGCAARPARGSGRARLTTRLPLG